LGFAFVSVSPCQLWRQGLRLVGLAGLRLAFSHAGHAADRVSRRVARPSCRLMPASVGHTQTGSYLCDNILRRN
jgi:hypothetical protein